MIECGKFVVVGIPSLRIATVQILCKFQHIIGVATFRTINVIDKIHASILCRKMLATAITTKGKATFSGHNIPKE